MTESRTILVLSDIHYASDAERKRGAVELDVIKNGLLRTLVRVYRRFLWRRDPFAHNHLLQRFAAEMDGADFVVGNGDYSCDTAFVGLADDAALASAQQCLGYLRARFGSRLRLTLGDHELGKMSLFGGCGGMRLASWHRAQSELGLEPFWTLELGQYLLVGVTSSLLAYPIYEPEALPEERAEWQKLRRQHLDTIREAFQGLYASQRVVLFCHDPTALPFLWRDEAIRSKVEQVEITVIGHLHSSLFLWKSRLLSGMPAITVLGNSVRRMSLALHDARIWRYFRVQLCPALAGIELLKDGGYVRLQLDPQGVHPLQFAVCRLGSTGSMGQPCHGC